jgi:two-component system sensor histidine kinase BaeS
LTSLRSRLIVSHVAVVALAFVLLTLAAAVPVRRAQLRAENTRLLSVADAVALQTAVVARLVNPNGGNATLQTLVEREAQRGGAWLLLLSDDGTILHDSRAGAATGTRDARLAGEISRLRVRVDAAGARALPLALGNGIGRLNGHLAALATTTSPNTGAAARLYVVAIAPNRRVPVLAGVLRPLVFAAGLALLVGVVTSVALARSIANPLARLTSAASGISAGNLDARLPGAGDDEVGTLVRAFNAMLERLAATYTAQQTLLANIAHELRTPLTSIQGYAQALRDGAAVDATERETALAVIGAEAQRMSELVNQILQLSRLESGQLALQREPVPLAPLLARLRRTLAPQAATGGVALHVTAPDDLTVSADPELLTQALSNLAFNALRHTPSGGRVAINATTFVANDGARHARIAVSDTGSGIAADQLEQIFERFYRGPDAATDEQSSVSGARRFGLGLAITREIVRRHGGTLTVASAPGAGTTFAMHLPDVLAAGDDGSAPSAGDA